MLQSKQQYIAAGGDVFGVEFKSNGRQKQEIIHGWEKQTQFCVSFIALFSQKQELSNTARL